MAVSKIRLHSQSVHIFSHIKYIKCSLVVDAVNSLDVMTLIPCRGGKQKTHHKHRSDGQPPAVVYLSVDDLDGVQVVVEPGTASPHVHEVTVQTLLLTQLA